VACLLPRSRMLQFCNKTRLRKFLILPPIRTPANFCKVLLHSLRPKALSWRLSIWIKQTALSNWSNSSKYASKEPSLNCLHHRLTYLVLFQTSWRQPAYKMFGREQNRWAALLIKAQRRHSLSRALPAASLWRTRWLPCPSPWVAPTKNRWLPHQPFQPPLKSPAHACEQ